MVREYRAARPEELEEFVYSGAVGFGMSTEEAEIERRLSRVRERNKPAWTLCAFEDGVMASKMLTLPFSMRWNGRPIGCGGVTAVTTLPSHRRRGHLRELMTRAFGTMRESGQPVAMLWASMAAIYQRFGYGIAYSQWIARFDRRHLRFVDEIPTPGRVRLVKNSEALPVIREAYRRFAAPRTLMLERDEEAWAANLLRPWVAGAPPYLVAVYEEDEQVLGYVTYQVEQHRDWQPGPDQELQVGDLVWLTPAAHRALMQYLAGYDLVRDIRIQRLPVDDPLFAQTQEPSLLQLRVEDGTLLRIVDLAAALAGRGYDADGRLRLALQDELCPWNSGTWELEVEGGRGRVRRSQAAPELCLTPRVLAILASGHQNATTLARIGLLPETDARALTRADDLFRTTHAPLCMDGF